MEKIFLSRKENYSQLFLIKKL